MPATDPSSMVAALVAIFSVAAVVWLMIAAGLRESPWGCASLAGANGLLALSFLLYDRAFIPPVLPAHAWWPDTLSLAAFGLVQNKPLRAQLVSYDPGRRKVAAGPRR